MPSRLANRNDVRDLNIASAVAIAVAVFAFILSLGVLLTPVENWSNNSFMGWMVVRFTAWLPAGLMLLTAMSLFGAAWKERRLLSGMVFSTLFFAFWALAPLVAARLGAIDPPTLLSLTNYGWFAGLCGYCSVRLFRLNRRG